MRESLPLFGQTRGTALVAVFREPLGAARDDLNSLTMAYFPKPHAAVAYGGDRKRAGSHNQRFCLLETRKSRCFRLCLPIRFDSRHGATQGGVLQLVFAPVILAMVLVGRDRSG